MNRKKRTIIWIVILIIILVGTGGAGSIYYYFFAKQFQLTKTTYIYIDRDDNLDSVYQKIIRNGHPKSMFGFQYLAEKKKYGDNILSEIKLAISSESIMSWRETARTNLSTVRTLGTVRLMGVWYPMERRRKK